MHPGVRKCPVAGYFTSPQRTSTCLDLTTLSGLFRGTTHAITANHRRERAALKYHSPTIVVVEKDPDEKLLLRRALNEGRFSGNSRFVQTGEELRDYLARSGKYTSAPDAPFPSLILLDLHVIRDNVPALVASLKEDTATRRIPIVVLAPPISEEDCGRCYDAGANALVEKPLGYDEFRTRIAALLSFWFEVVSLPSPY